MIKDVQNYIKGCKTCKIIKAPNLIMKPEMGKKIISERPFQRLYIDLLGS